MVGDDTARTVPAGGWDDLANAMSDGRRDSVEVAVLALVLHFVIGQPLAHSLLIGQN